MIFLDTNLSFEMMKVIRSKSEIFNTLIFFYKKINYKKSNDKS